MFVKSTNIDDLVEGSGGKGATTTLSAITQMKKLCNRKFGPSKSSLSTDA